MKLTLLSQGEYTSTVLPDKCAGRYWVQARDGQGRLTNIVAVEAQRPAEKGALPQWVLRSNRRYRVMGGEDTPLQSAPVTPMALYRIESTGGQEGYVLYTEPLTRDRQRYRCYEILGREARLTLGRGGDNHIVYDNRFVSSSHTELLFTPRGLAVRDLDSVNHTYVNGRSVEEQWLSHGDVIYVMGLQLVWAGRFLFFNDPDGRTAVHSPHLRPCRLPPAPPRREEAEWDQEDEGTEEDYYYRPPRFKQDVGAFELKIDAPPAEQGGDEVPMIMLIGPSMTMGMASIATGALAVTNALERGDFMSALPSLVMSVSMLLGTLMWPLITKGYQRRMRRKKEKKRQESYLAYLEEMGRLIAQETARQEQILRSNDVSMADHVARMLMPIPQIWERTHKHSDFLVLRLGYGTLPLNADIQYTPRRFTVEQDPLTEAMYRFGEQSHQLRDVPICLPLAERYVSGVYATPAQRLAYARSLILQLVALHGYDEVKLALLYDESCGEALSFARFLPHTMDRERGVRYIATNSEEAKALSAALDPIIEYRKSLGEEKRREETPYFVILCLDKALAEKTECVRRIQGWGENLGFSVLSIFDRLQDLPKECSAVVELEGAGGKLTRIDDVSEPSVPFRLDAAPQVDLERVIRVLANTEMDLSGSRFTLPKKYTFFQMLDMGMVEHLNLTETWAANDPTKSLAAQVGIDQYGEPFKLDLHERSHGPHGLVAGMTGSGKSEFIITYILSMAVNYHPYEVAFILIDYKGGGMAKSFEGIPHTAGVITNLDGNGIKRSLASMRSELHRRERIFRDVSEQHSVSNIDIYKYQKLYRQGKVKEPLPHLILISDEFAELKKEQPDFMAELTSTARVGRSLGVHLILATQKPGGVVDDQIRSNSRFRVCLKVQDNGDSMEMLGRPEAAALVDTGRFYLQVGNNELFELGQSAWAGAPYYPSPHVIRDRDDGVSVIGTGGQVIAEANIDPFAAVKDPPKQLDVVTEYIRKVSRDEGIVPWHMWLPPIPGSIYLEDLSRKYRRQGAEPFVLEPLVGEYDEPACQRQGPLTLPLTKGGNAVVYGSAGSGKEMFLQAMCCSLLWAHGPREVNLYLLDFDAQTLTAFSGAPQVGDVILSYETEKVRNLFKLLLGKMDTRKKNLAAFGGDFLQYNAAARTPEPNLVVVIHNFAAFQELFEDLGGELNYLTREGTKYGIYFVLTCTGVNNVRFSLLQNFKSLYCLQLNNPDDYPTVLGKTEGLCPEGHTGRGLVRLGRERLVEFQTAAVTRESPHACIRTLGEELRRRCPGERAQPVPVLPERVTADFLAPHVTPGDLSALPVGVEKETLDIARYDFTRSPVTLVLAVDREWETFLPALARLTAEQGRVRTVLFTPQGDKTLPPGCPVEEKVGPEACLRGVYDLFDLVLKRNNTYKDAIAAGEEPPRFETVAVMIPSVAQLKSVLEGQKAGGRKEAGDDTPWRRMQLAMEKCRGEYGVYFLAAESLGALTPFTAEGWYKAQVGGSDGIWLGSGVSSQYRITVSKKPPGYAADLAADFGYTITRGAAVQVKFLQGEGEAP